MGVYTLWVIPTGHRQRRLAGAGGLLGLALVIVVAVLAWNSLAERPNGISMGPAALLAVLVLPTFATVSLEFLLVARVLGVIVPLRQAGRVTVIATAANFLPLPGSALTRMYVLRREGVGSGPAAQALMATAGLWLGVSFVATGIGIAVGHPLPALALVAAGIGGGSIAMVWLTRLGASRRHLLGLTLVEVVLTMTGILRVWLAFAALSLDGSLRDAAALTAASPASAAIGIVPAGLGVRESFAAALGSLSGSGAAAAGLAATFDRAMGLLILIPLAIALSRGGDKIRAEETT